MKNEELTNDKNKGWVKQVMISPHFSGRDKVHQNCQIGKNGCLDRKFPILVMFSTGEGVVLNI